MLTTWPRCAALAAGWARGWPGGGGELGARRRGPCRRRACAGHNRPRLAALLPHLVPQRARLCRVSAPPLLPLAPQAGVKDVRAAAFLHGYAEPVLLLLHEAGDPSWGGALRLKKDTCALAALSLDLGRRAHPRIWAAAGLPCDAWALSPAPCGGALVLCLNMVLYYSQARGPRRAEGAASRGGGCGGGDQPRWRLAHAARLPLTGPPAPAPPPPLQSHQSGVVLNEAALPMPAAPTPLVFDARAAGGPGATAAAYARRHASDVHPQAAAAALAFCDAEPAALNVTCDGASVAWLGPEAALLALRSGQLLLLTLRAQPGGKRQLAVARAGAAPPPSCCCSLGGGGLLFLGSAAGDSLLVRAAPAAAAAAGAKRATPAAGPPSKRLRLESGEGEEAAAREQAATAAEAVGGEAAAAADARAAAEAAAAAAAAQAAAEEEDAEALLYGGTLEPAAPAGQQQQQQDGRYDLAVLDSLVGISSIQVRRWRGRRLGVRRRTSPARDGAGAARRSKGGVDRHPPAPPKP